MRYLRGRCFYLIINFNDGSFNVMTFPYKTLPFVALIINGLPLTRLKLL